MKYVFLEKWGEKSCWYFISRKPVTLGMPGSVSGFRENYSPGWRLECGKDTDVSMTEAISECILILGFLNINYFEDFFFFFALKENSNRLSCHISHCLFYYFTSAKFCFRCYLLCLRFTTLLLHIEEVENHIFKR